MSTYLPPTIGSRWVLCAEEEEVWVSLDQLLRLGDEELTVVIQHLSHRERNNGSSVSLHTHTSFCGIAKLHSVTVCDQTKSSLTLLRASSTSVGAKLSSSRIIQ